jgi:hypothetical protein
MFCLAILGIGVWHGKGRGHCATLVHVSTAAKHLQPKLASEYPYCCHPHAVTPFFALAIIKHIYIIPCFGKLEPVTFTLRKI